MRSWRCIALGLVSGSPAVTCVSAVTVDGWAEELGKPDAIVHLELTATGRHTRASTSTGGTDLDILSSIGSDLDSNPAGPPSALRPDALRMVGKQLPRGGPVHLLTDDPRPGTFVCGHPRLG